jgi:hypothetical protein
MNSRIKLRPLVLLLACGVLMSALGGVAYAAAKTLHGVTPVSPKPGATVAVGKSPTFKLRVKGKGQVWVYVCKSKKKDKEGLICNDASIGRAHKHGSVYQYKPTFYDYPEFWLNTPGTYYWQAHRIDCNAADCAQEGPITKFKVG